MATKIITKNSSTATSIPTAGDLVQGELAVNVTDKRLFTEDSGGAIVELGTNPSTLTSGAATFSGAVSLNGAAQSDSITNTLYMQNLAGTRAANIQLDASGGVSIFDYNGSAWNKSLTLEGGAATFSGNVGIGTSSPDATLDVTRPGNGEIAVLQTSANRGFSFQSQSDTALQIASVQGSTNLDLWANTLSFSAGGAERMRIDSSGNLGLGGSTITDYSGTSFLINASAGSAARIKLTTATSGTGITNGGGITYDTSNNLTLLNRELGSIIFYTNNTDVGRIDASGNLFLGGVAAGTVSGNDARITIRRDSGNCGISYQSGTAATDQWETYTSLAARFYIENTSTSNGAYLQYNSSSGWTNISDERWKTNWTSLGESSSKIAALNVGKYHMLNNSKESIEGAKWDYGVKAQELLEVIPDAVDVPENPEDKYGVVSNIVFWHAVKAIQEQQATIEALTARIEALEGA